MSDFTKAALKGLVADELSSLVSEFVVIHDYKFDLEKFDMETLDSTLGNVLRVGIDNLLNPEDGLGEGVGELDIELLMELGEECVCVIPDYIGAAYASPIVFFEFDLEEV